MPRSRPAITPYILKGLALLALTMATVCSHALFVSPAKDPIPLIHTLFPQASTIGDKDNESFIWTIHNGEEILGYAFETNDIARIPAYSGEPVNILIAIDTHARYIGARVLEHHEPIILAGIPETKLHQFVDQYSGLHAQDRLKVGGKIQDGIIPIDGLSGATVTVMVMNVAITKATTKVARTLGLIAESQEVIVPMAKLKPDAYIPTDWQTLVGDGSLRKLFLSHKMIDDAFVGTDAEGLDKTEAENELDMFSEIYFAQLNLPHIGRNLLGEQEYQWLEETLQANEHAIIVMGNGYSYKGSGYVRGGIFDRLQILQNGDAISFRDVDHTRLSDLMIDGAPKFREMSLFIRFFVDLCEFRVKYR